MATGIILLAAGTSAASRKAAPQLRGWHTDLRWWNGREWTGHTHDNAADVSSAPPATP